ncbi:MAG: hypothetical protein KatS3mg057_1742 [Herpetosiphonaceae bacterium]|nr:MAG: hypothetical protein KatS3mg057_1742 [Herpetosiphonaceae bacterium]
MRRALATLLVLLSFALSACALSGNSPETVYDLIEQPERYSGQQVTVLGTYLWKPGNPALSVLVPGVSTTDAGTDAQPLGEAVWLEGFPAEVTADLHRPGDAVYGVVEVTGQFEQGGNYGPEGSYSRRLVVTSARVVERIERITVQAPKSVPEGVTPLQALFDDPGRYHGQRVTTRGYYFWSPATAGLLAAGVEAEKVDGVSDPQIAAAGINPRPLEPFMAMDGFPPELSPMLHVGPGNSFVWGLVEVTGLFETGGAWGPNGTLQHHFQIEKVTPLESTE